MHIHIAATNRIHFGGLVDIHTDVSPTVTVVSFEELIHKRVVFFFAHIGVHHQLGEQVSAQLAKLTRGAVAVALREHTLCVVLGKELHIGLQNVQVCISGNVVSKVGGVVPDVNIVTDFAPLLKILAESCIFRTGGVVEWMCEVAVEGAKTNANVLGRLCYLGSGLRVVVSKRVDNNVGVILCNIICNCIDKAKERACGAALFGINGYAVRAGATRIGIVLRNRENSCAGSCRKAFANSRNCAVEVVLIGQAGVL